MQTAATHHPHHHHHHPTNVLGTNQTTNNNVLASLNNQEFLVNLNSYNNDGFGENIGNGTTNLYIIRTPLARWNEECTVLDSQSMHHAILLSKPVIMNALEKYRNEELNEKREKKLKEEKDKEKEKQQKQQQQQQAAAAVVDVKSVTVVAEQISEDLNAPADLMVVQQEAPPPVPEVAPSRLQIEEIADLASTPNLERCEQASMQVVVNEDSERTEQTVSNEREMNDLNQLDRAGEPSKK